MYVGPLGGFTAADIAERLKNTLGFYHVCMVVLQDMGRINTHMAPARCEAQGSVAWSSFCIVIGWTSRANMMRQMLLYKYSADLW